MNRLLNKKPDVVIVGTGMGGATLGYALAKKGAKVLFLEKGLSHLSSRNKLFGTYAETHLQNLQHETWETIFKRSGRYDEPINDISKNHTHSFVPFIGLGAGGSSSIYGGILERFYPEDFAPSQFYTRYKDKNPLPHKWPISYSEMENPVDTKKYCY